MTIYTEQELDAANKGFCYYRFLYDGMGLRKLCRDPNSVKTGHGAIVFDWEAYHRHEGKNAEAEAFASLNRAKQDGYRGSEA